MKTVLSEFAESYVLRYTPRGVERSGWHDLGVTVTKPRGNKLTVNARRGYFAN
jgi:hypothetical protein